MLIIMMDENYIGALAKQAILNLQKIVLFTDSHGSSTTSATLPPTSNLPITSTEDLPAAKRMRLWVIISKCFVDYAYIPIGELYVGSEQLGELYGV